MLRYLLLSIPLFLMYPVCAIQTCDDSPGLLSLLFSGDDDEYDYEPTYGRDTVRTENFEVKYGVNFLVPNGIDDLRPAGMELAFYQALPNHPRVYLGGSFSIFNHGAQSYDTLFGDYDEISTFNNIYGISFLMKHQVIDTKVFKAFLGFRTGLFFFHSYSKAFDTTEPCEDQELGKTLHSMMSIRPNVGPTLDLQIPIKSTYDRISFHIGYRMSGRTPYVLKENVDIQPHRIDYLKSVNNLNMLSFQIGFSHFF